MPLPKIIYPTGGANTLTFHREPRRVAHANKRAVRHDAISTAGVKQSILERVDEFLEFQVPWASRFAANYLTRTEEIDHADWVKNEVLSVSADSQIAPDGTMTAERVTPAVAATNTWVRNLADDIVLPFIDGATFVFLVWLKAASGTPQIRINLNRANDTNIAFKTVTLTTSWGDPYFVTGVFDSTTEVRCYVGAGGIPWTEAKGPIDIWGGQLAYGNFPRRYEKNVEAVPADIFAWDSFFDEALKGTEFDYYPDKDAAGNAKYTLEDTDFEAAYKHPGQYGFKVKFRKAA